jgi:Lipocalin-like domain
MNRRSIFALGTMAALGLALLPSDLNAQPRSLKEQLIGTWTIVSWEDIAPNGTKRQITDPKGFLIFDSGGRYAQVIARSDRPKFNSSGQPTAEELAAAVEDFFAANAGTWSVSEAERLLTQQFEAALRPNNEGTAFRSGITLSGDELRLVAVRPLPTGARIDVVYRRAK